jgi:glucose-6-phosphate isomerase
METVSTRNISGLNIDLDLEGLGFRFGEDMHAVPEERRHLDAVRASLMNPDAEGPDVLYTIYMDFCYKKDREQILRDDLLYGGVIYAAGRMGQEYVRSQGHRHTCNEHGISYPEVYEFWHGTGLIYAQREVGPNVSACYTMRCTPGTVAIVPPNWVHLTVNIGDEPLAFGAWCARKQRFDYEPVRKMRGAAWYFLADGTRARNPLYNKVANPLDATPRDYHEFDIVQNKPVYQQYLEDPKRFRFMTNPHEFLDQWKRIEARP